jgi:hypothetical protein
MEKKARVQRLSRQDDVKRSWANAYPSLEEFEVEEFEDIEVEATAEEPAPDDRPNPETPPPEA